MSQVVSRTAATGQGSVAKSLNAPLFHKLIERLADGQRAIVLDLGPARTETLALFGQFRCRMEIADVPASLDELRADADSDALADAIEAVLPDLQDNAADVVLCWDLLNYLARPALKSLMARIAARGQAGTLVHALIAYSGAEMPARPNRYAPVDEQHLDVLPVTDETIVSPRYSPEDLALCMPAYTMVRAMLLRNGMQEFLFRL